MTTPPNQPLDPETIEAYLLGQLPEDQVEPLDRRLRNDPQALHQLSEAIQVMSLVRQEFASEAQYQAANGKEPLLQDFNTLLKELGELEASAETVTLAVEEVSADEPADERSLSRHDFVAAGSYLFRHTFTPKVIAALATAAALLLGVTLLIVLSAPEQAESPVTAGANDSEQSAPAASPVATLTAQHEARWVGGDRVTGQPLHPGQRLTLLQGYVEIETEHGATAILEAPCSIEFTDSKNAIVLNHGKLVGQCLTPKSRGFTVHTPDAKVVDIGTVFGVKVDGQTVAHVIEGEIDVAPANSDETVEPVRLTAGQAVRVDAESQRVVAVASPTEPYTTSWSHIAGLRQHGTGALAYLDAAPADLRLGASESDHMQMFLERESVRLQQDVSINFIDPGQYQLNADQSLATKVVPAGTVVDSYLIHYDPLGDSGPAGGIGGRTDFGGRPILGFITSDALIAETNGLFAAPGTRYRQLEQAGSEDGAKPMGRVDINYRNLGFRIQMYADGPPIKQIRVLVASDQEPDL